MKGLVFDIQKFSIHDGPGIRTTVFMKGCPLKCLWCHNPESQKSEREISFQPSKCIGCGWCFSACPNGCQRIDGSKRIFERDNCLVCGKCAEKCYAGGLEIVGREMRVDEVIDEAMKDKAFYDTSGGGMTLSGGEPLFQPEFTVALLNEAKKNELHTCVETCGFASYNVINRIRRNVDVFLYDLKETDSQKHEDCTGVPLGPILENLRKLDATGSKIILRCPIIPSLNDRPEHINGIAEIVNGLDNILEINLMPYHPLGQSKFERMGYKKDLELKSFADSGKLNQLRERLASLCKVNVRIE